MKQVIIGTVGYHNLCNHSIGSVLRPELQMIAWAPGVEVDELNWGPIAIVQKFQARTAPYQRVILLAALERPGRAVGDISVFRWGGSLPDEELIQRCVGDAVTGVTSVENLLIIGEYFKIWPSETLLVDVEPGPEQAGEHFTPEMQAAIPELIRTLQYLTVADEGQLLTYEPLYGDTLIQEA